MRVWLLAFMFNQQPLGLQPMVSGPFDLEVCLYMAQQNRIKYGYRAHCYNPRTIQRKYPDMRTDYLPVKS